MVGLLVHQVLEMGGFSAHYFQDPLAALDAYSRPVPKPDLLLTDFAMPALDGMELIERCRAQCPSQKTILYSGTSEAEIFSRYKTRPSLFLAKPFPPLALIEAARRLIASPPIS